MVKTLHIDSVDKLDEFKTAVNTDKKVFVLVYMEGCGPCIATRPEWENIGKTLKDQYPDVYVVDIDQSVVEGVKNIIGDIQGFPTMKYISNSGKNVSPYSGERTVDAFIKWIEDKTKVFKSSSKLSNRITNKLLTKSDSLVGGKKTKRKNRRRKSRRSRKSRKSGRKR